MIQLKINNMDHKAVLTVPADYERVTLALWTLGLDRDPEKYTLRQLDAEFTYTTEEESQMVRLIDPRSSLMNALCLLSEMVYPPYPVAQQIHKKMAAGGYASEDDFFIEMEKFVYDKNLDMRVFYFPISGEVVNKRGLVRKASDPLLVKYEHLIHSAIHRVQRQISGSDTKLFEDVDGVYQKLMGVSWSVDSVSGFLVGQVILFLTEPLTEDEAESAAEKIEMINSTLFPIKLKHWSALTDEGLLFAYLCDEDGDYSLYETKDTVLYGQMYVYNGAHNWDEFASNVAEATISLAECGTSFCISDSANAWYHVTIVVEEPEQPESNPITEIELAHPNFVKNEQTGEVSMTMVTGTSEQIDLSFAVANEELDATQVILWTSSDPETASVENGKVTAHKAGTVTITAKAVDASGIALAAEEDEVLAQFTLTVADPTDGYTVTMGEDVEAVVNNTVSVPVTIGHTGDVTKYNAFDLTFEYDPTVLELTSTKIDGMTVTVKDGKIHVERYGTDLTVGSTALTLTFKAIATGNTNVKVTSAKVDISESALTKDAPDASVIDNITLVAVTGFTVSLPAEFTGESSVLPGENYTFEAKDKNYNYTFDGSTMDGQPVTVKDNGDGTFSIENVTGNIVIKTVPTGKTFSVTLGEDMTGETSAKYMTPYTATLNKADGYNYNVTVTINNVKFTGFTYDAATGLITIPGEAITGEIVFNSNKTAKTPDKHSVEFAGEYGDIAEGTLMEVENGTDYVLTINKVLGYKYTVTATMGGEPVEVKDNGDGTYTIKNVTGDLVITIAKEYDLTVEVAEYVKLNGKAMFLVTATGSVDEGKILAYDGTAMFWSEQYNAWSHLVITEGTLSVEDAKAKITLNEGEKVELAQTYNINESASGTVDINDAQLVFDMYNNKYQDFDNATMQKFLKADVNGDKAINVNDAAAVVSVIVENKNK